MKKISPSRIITVTSCKHTKIYHNTLTIWFWLETIKRGNLLISKPKASWKNKLKTSRKILTTSCKHISICWRAVGFNYISDEVAIFICFIWFLSHVYLVNNWHDFDMIYFTHALCICFERVDIRANTDRANWLTCIFDCSNFISNCNIR